MSAEGIHGEHPVGPIKGPLPNVAGSQDLEGVNKQNELYLSFQTRVDSLRNRGELPPHLSSKEDLARYISDLSVSIKILLESNEPNAFEQAGRLSHLLEIAREHYGEL